LITALKQTGCEEKERDSKIDRVKSRMNNRQIAEREKATEGGAGRENK